MAFIKLTQYVTNGKYTPVIYRINVNHIVGYWREEGNYALYTILVTTDLTHAGGSIAESSKWYVKEEPEDIDMMMDLITIQKLDK